MEEKTRGAISRQSRDAEYLTCTLAAGEEMMSGYWVSSQSVTHARHYVTMNSRRTRSSVSGVEMTHCHLINHINSIRNSDNPRQCPRWWNTSRSSVVPPTVFSNLSRLLGSADHNAPQLKPSTTSLLTYTLADWALRRRSTWIARCKSRKPDQLSCVPQ